MKHAFNALLFLALVITTSSAFGQKQTTQSTFNTEEIAAMEQERFANTPTQGLQANAFINSSTDFDVKYYRCEWEIDPAVRFVKGKITVYYTITKNTAAILFDLVNGLNVESVTQRNASLGFQHSNDILQVNFPGSVTSGTLDSISINYNGAPPNTGFGSYVNNFHNGVPVTWTLSAPYGSRDWWPCKNGLDDKADSIDVFITHPVGYKAVSNGLRQSEISLGNGKNRTHWKHRYPITTYLICLAITNYSEFTASMQLGESILPIQTFCYPENLTQFQQGTQNTMFAMALYHEYFGDYPFINEKYGHIQFGWGGGMEHQTGSFMVNLGEGLVAHELAHQWFGDKITCATWEDIWLNEGFASFLTSFYLEDKYMPIQRNNMLATRLNEINNITSQPGGSVWVDDTTNVNRIFSSRLTYKKGSHLLYMLRWKLGDEVFFKAMKNYSEDPKLHYNFARTIDFQRHLEAVSGADLTEFFKDWFKGQGYPSYTVQWTPIGDDHVRIKMNQTTSHPSVDFFELPVALKFKNATQDTTIVVDNQKNGEIFYRKIGFIPDQVIIDPEYWLISRNNVAERVEDDAPAENMVKVYPNPVQSQFSVYLRNFSQPNALISVYNLQGQKIFTQSVNMIDRANIIEIPSADWPNGMYSIKVESNGFSNLQKLIK